MKRLLARVSAIVSLFFCSSALGAVVLEYHHVSDSGPASTRISPAAFEAQLDYLREAGFSVVPLTDLVVLLEKGKPLPEKTVAITFDDSYASVYRNAFPILKKRNLPFTFFVNTDAVGTSPSFVTWEQLREMQKHGATIANHTATHAHMVRKRPNESLEDWKARLASDITRAQQAIEKNLGGAPNIFAYPFGEYNQVAKSVVRELGYIGFGQHSGVMSSDADSLIIPRFPFGGSFTDLADFKLKVNSKAMPLKKIQWYDQLSTPLSDVIVREGERPWLALTPDGDLRINDVRCYATGQGSITTEVRDGIIWAQATKPFKPGRMRYNCTAPTGEKGRFYWFTQQWLVTDKSGNWTYQD